MKKSPGRKHQNSAMGDYETDYIPCVLKGCNLTAFLVNQRLLLPTEAIVHRVYFRAKMINHLHGVL